MIPHSSRDYNTGIKKGLKMLQRNQRGIYRQFQLTKKWEYVENEKRKSMKNSELNSAGKINAGKPIKKYSVLTEGNTSGHCTNP